MNLRIFAAEKIYQYKHFSTQLSDKWLKITDSCDFLKASYTLEQTSRQKTWMFWKVNRTRMHPSITRKLEYIYAEAAKKQRTYQVNLKSAKPLFYWRAKCTNER